MADNRSVGVSCPGGDRISDLPDNLLHHILVLIPLVEAVRTCVLSRRWGGVWTRLPRLLFQDVDAAAAAPRVRRFPDLVDGVLRGYADDVDIDDLFISVDVAAGVDDPVRLAAATAALAAPRVTARFGIFLSPDAVNLYMVGEATLQLPCFPRATEFSVTFMGVDLRMPETGTFARLTKLYLAGVRFTDDGEGISDAVSSRCPRIRVLELLMVDGLRVLTVASQSLLSLRLSAIMELERLGVVAGNLREMVVDTCFVLNNAGALMLLSVPALEKLHWEDCCPGQLRPWKLPGCLRRLVVTCLKLECLVDAAGGSSNFMRILQLFPRVHTLRLEVPIAPDHADQNNPIENVNLPYCSELEFIANQTKHKFGPTIISLLKKSSCVRKLSLQMFRREQAGYIPCTSDCNCRQLSIWRDKGVDLISLEWVVMYGFSETQDEKSFIYYIMRKAKGLRRVSLVLSVGVNPTRRFLRKLCTLSMSGCNIEFYSC
uniref:F-box domain-containing protein n=1 Tax=Setaria viridis TaxID=4556 RepID=A0A4V6DBS8_SETVI|nr:hypothetical protein SEVIR_2G355400v2 [Setaria viridis]